MIRCGLPRIRNRRGGPLRPRGSRHRGPRRPRGGTDPADAGGAAGSGWLDDPGAVRTRPMRAGPRAAESARAGPRAAESARACAMRARRDGIHPASRRASPARRQPAGPTRRSSTARPARKDPGGGSTSPFRAPWDRRGGLDPRGFPRSPVPGAVGQARRARPARVSEKPRSGRRGTGDRARRRGRRVAASGRHRRGVGEGVQLLARGRGRPAGDDVHVTVRLDGPPVQGRR